MAQENGTFKKAKGECFPKGHIYKMKPLPVTLLLMAIVVSGLALTGTMQLGMAQIRLTAQDLSTTPGATDTYRHINQPVPQAVAYEIIGVILAITSVAAIVVLKFVRKNKLKSIKY